MAYFTQQHVFNSLSIFIADYTTICLSVNLLNRHLGPLQFVAMMQKLLQAFKYKSLFKGFYIFWVNI